MGSHIFYINKYQVEINFAIIYKYQKILIAIYLAIFSFDAYKYIVV